MLGGHGVEKAAGGGETGVFAVTDPARGDAQGGAAQDGQIEGGVGFASGGFLGSGHADALSQAAEKTTRKIHESDYMIDPV